jgi:hypothetical protein
VAAAALRRWGLQRVQSRLDFGFHRRPRLLRGDADALASVRRIAWIVDGVAHQGLWRGNCLQRSLVLWWFLRRRGLLSEIRIGVRRRPDSPSQRRELDFHAWVEFDGHVVNDESDIRTMFATFDRAIIPRGARWR